MMASRVSPNYKATKVSNLKPGDLFLMSAGSETALCLFIDNCDKAGVRAYLKLSPNYSLGDARKQGDKTVFVVGDEWRFSLKPPVPAAVGAPLTKVPSGCIAVCEEGHFMTSVVGGPLDLEVRIIDIDSGCFTDSMRGKESPCLYSKWTLETRRDSSEPWQEFYEPQESTRGYAIRGEGRQYG